MKFTLGLTGACLFFLVLICWILQYNLSCATAAMLDQQYTVIIDAGHGGEDGGAIGIGGSKESQINLAISLKLDQLLRFCGIETTMIRETDHAVYTDGSTLAEKKVSDLKNRVTITNGTPRAILVSIHQNHFGDPQYTGAQVFYSTFGESRMLALNMQDSLKKWLNPDNRREVKQAESLYLMEKTQCIGVLVECGFLSNPKEEQNLLQSDYQKKITCALTEALVQFTTEGNDDLEV